ncbi:MAG TPA: urease accessory UreF family protein [Streptosporangiaceae bacterium]|jgi:urease accessory protein|nr:urease accessory UreF family protein [Streptosporangiaceae bacterium]
MNSLLLLLLDSRAPAGAHHHSGGMEAAIGTGLVTGLAGLEDFCRARLRTSARVGAAFAAAAARLQSDSSERSVALAARNGPARPGAESRARAAGEWALLDAEFEARTPSEAMRTASRQLGRGLVRLLRSVQPEADLATAFSRCAGPAPHHPLVLGAAVSLAGGGPDLAARAAALAACAGPASAAVRLLGLDPFAVQAMLARLAPGIDACAAAAARLAAGPPASLPADAAPALDLLADFHLTAEVRLFAS